MLLEQQQHGEFVCGGVVVLWWLTHTTYIQLAGAGSTDTNYLYPARWDWINSSSPMCVCSSQCHHTPTQSQLDPPYANNHETYIHII